MLRSDSLTLLGAAQLCSCIVYIGCAGRDDRCLADTRCSFSVVLQRVINEQCCLGMQRKSDCAGHCRGSGLPPPEFSSAPGSEVSKHPVVWRSLGQNCRCGTGQDPGQQDASEPRNAWRSVAVPLAWLKHDLSGSWMILRVCMACFNSDMMQFHWVPSAHPAPSCSVQ